MGEPRFYIPVDPPMTLDALKRVPLEQLLTRSLDDPMYATFDPDFDWRRLVTVRIANPRLYAQTLAALDRMATTPTGQHRIRQAHAVHCLRLRDAIVPGALSPNLRITSRAEPVRGPNLGVLALGTAEPYLTPALEGGLDALRDPLRMLAVYAPAQALWQAQLEASRPVMAREEEGSDPQFSDTAGPTAAMGASFPAPSDWLQRQARLMLLRERMAPASPRQD